VQQLLEVLDAAAFQCDVGFKERVELRPKDTLDLRDAVLGVLNRCGHDGAEACDEVCVSGGGGGEGKP